MFSLLANTAAVCAAALLPYFSINPAEIEVENISFFGGSQMLALLANTFIASSMYSPHNSLKFDQNIRTPLASKSNNFFKTFVDFSKSI